MRQENHFYYQLAKTMQAWLLVETEAYLIYKNIMKGANPHLISVTFHSIESFESKLKLIDSCFSLFFNKESSKWKKWRSLQNKARKHNAKRNKIVHQPVKTGVSDGEEFIEISPSFFNAQALVKGQTSYNGPVIDPSYKPSLAKISDDHKINLQKLRQYEKDFKEFSRDIESYRNDIDEVIRSALDNIRKATP